MAAITPLYSELRKVARIGFLASSGGRGLHPRVWLDAELAVWSVNYMHAYMDTYMHTYTSERTSANANACNFFRPHSELGVAYSRFTYTYTHTDMLYKKHIPPQWKASKKRQPSLACG